MRRSIGIESEPGVRPPASACCSTMNRSAAISAGPFGSLESRGLCSMNGAVAINARDSRA